MNLIVAESLDYVVNRLGLAGDQGFEPRLNEPESLVLPLHQSPVLCDPTSGMGFMHSITKQLIVVARPRDLSR